MFRTAHARRRLLSKVLLTEVDTIIRRGFCSPACTPGLTPNLLKGEIDELPKHE